MPDAPAARMSPLRVPRGPPRFLRADQKRQWTARSQGMCRPSGAPRPVASPRFRCVNDLYLIRTEEGRRTTGNTEPRMLLTESYQRHEGLTGMRAGLPGGRGTRLRAKSMRYQRPVGQPRSQDFGPLVSFRYQWSTSPGRMGCNAMDQALSVSAAHVSRFIDSGYSMC